MIYDDNYVDLIINFFEGYDMNQPYYQGGCVNEIAEQIAILHKPRGESYLTNLETTPYSSVPKLFGLMDSSNMEATGVKRVQNTAGLGLDGSDVIVGVIDTGIDYTNPLFRKENGDTRIQVLWDQTIRDENTATDVPVPFYGTAYSANQINEALQSDSPFSVVPSRDSDGHGTFLTGIAAGGKNFENDFIGIATGADIAVVKLKDAKPYLREYFQIIPDVPAYSETDILYAAEYLVRYARQQRKPLSILIGLGSSNGGHLGGTYLERYFSNILENVGIMISTSAGNEGNTRLHYAGETSVLEDYQQVELNVAEGQEGFSLEFWGRSPTTFALGIISPQGDRIERIPPRFGQEELIRLPLARTSIYVAYQLAETYSGDELIFVRIVNPTPGLWRFLVYADESGQRTFDMWLPLRQFLRSNTYFLQANPQNTITVPGNAQLVMTMTAYNHLNGSIYADASRGYNARNQVKPDMAAPGVTISGPGLRSNFVTRTGTSVAAAHSAGMMALFFQWNIATYQIGIFFPRQIQSFFSKGAIRDSFIEYPNAVWGYGIMNIEAVFDEFRVADYPT
jgi:subtilisin family serine protease